MYASCYFIWSSLLFPPIIARGINDIYFFYANLTEFILLFFVRTRSSLKYFPKFITILNLCFLFYLNSYFYSSQYECFSLLTQLTFLVTFGFIKYYEQPALNGAWNPYGTYTPSYNNPRCGYHIVEKDRFMMGFDLFSMFQKLRFRE